MPARYSFLRSASRIIIGIGVLVMVVSLLIGITGLLTRDAITDAGLEKALFALGAIAAGLFIAAGGQLLQVIVNISDSLQRIEEKSPDIATEKKIETLVA